MRLTIALIAALLAFALPAAAESTAQHSALSYRGFSVDLSAAAGTPNIAAIETSVKHQLDIVADCGAKPAILAFFRAQPITVAPNALDTGGLYDRAHGIRIDAI